MRIFSALLLTSLLMLGAAWGVSAKLIHQQVADRMAASPQLDGTARRVTGFPLSFQLVIERPEWRSQDGQANWHGPELGLHAPSLQPNQITIAFPNRQDLQLGLLETTLTAETMQAMVTINLDRDLHSAALEMEAVSLTPALGITGLSAAHVNLQHTETARYALQGHVEGLRLTEVLAETLDPAAELQAAMIDDLQLTGTVEFASALPLQAPWPAVIALDLTDARLDWGRVQVGLTGQAVRNDAGQYDGRFDLRLEDWEPILALLRRYDVIPPDAAMMAAMFFAAQSEPGTNRLSLPLDLRGSLLSLGPFPLIQLPAL